jgi:hypothetical protein
MTFRFAGWGRGTLLTGAAATRLAFLTGYLLREIFGIV